MSEKTHAKIIAEQLTNIESLGDELQAVIAAGSLRKLLRHLDEAHKREVDKLNSALQAAVGRSDAEIDRLRREIAELKRAGNAANLREALIKIRDICQRVGMDISPLSKRYKSKECQAVNQCFRNAIAALAAPPRNYKKEVGNGD